jgi:uncharacterized membrane protein YfcA
MDLMPENSSESLDPASRRCLDRTRTAVLNLMVVTGLFIAISGGLLRWRAVHEKGIGSKFLHEKLMIGLLALAVVSFLSRRLLGRRGRLKDPETRASRFFWSHFLPALVAALAAPLGLLHGWLIVPALESIGPFWVVALALGFLALPREHELEGFARPIEPDEVSAP